MTWTTTARITANLGGLVDDVTAAAATGRKLAGIVVKYGVHGLTSKGRLKVAPNALTFPDDLGIVKLTREHDRTVVRGYLDSIVDDGQQLRVVASVSDGPEGDEAIREAQGRIREGLSFDIVDAVIVGDTITAGRVVAIGQVGVPAYDDGRIDSIAANLTPEGTTMLTPEQQARLAELAVMTSRSTEEEAELNALLAVLTGTVVGEEATASAAAPTGPAAPAAAATQQPAAAGHQQVAASMSAVGAGVPTPVAVVKESGKDAYNKFLDGLVDAFSAVSNKAGAVTAALQDITHTNHTADIEPFAWSGELFSGQEYIPEWADLFSTAPLTNWKGQGWRFTSKLEIQDYAGDKADIPSDNVTTEDSSYEAARMALGIDIDRKFFDFPNKEFLDGLLRQVRESYAIKKDDKVRAYALAQAVATTKLLSVTTTNGDATVTAATGSFKASDVGATFTAAAGIPASTTILSVTNSSTIELSANATATGVRVATIGAQEATLLKAAARGALSLKRGKVGQASFVVVNDEDMFTLLDIAEKELPIFLDLYNIEARNFRSSADVPAGTLVTGVKQAATFRELPGSPIRVDAQNLAKGGVDEAFFAYWAIEEHHTSGIRTVNFKPA